MRRAGFAALLLLVSCREATPARAPENPTAELFLLTSLPLVWSESFGVDQPGSTTLKALEQSYHVTPIDVPSQLPDGGLLLAAQPRALPAEELVALDAWVRRGGRLVLLADPMLEWRSTLPLGDPRRAPLAFPDTGLLRHWGLRLDAPDRRGSQQSTLGGRPVQTVSPGELAAVAGGCNIGDRGLSARCSIGKGEVVIAADADFLQPQLKGRDTAAKGNLPALLLQLASLSH